MNLPDNPINSDVNGKEKNQPVPPGAPDRTPIKDPKQEKPPKGDPQPPEKKKPRLGDNNTSSVPAVTREVILSQQSLQLLFSGFSK